MAFLTLFRVATGDNWNGIMKVIRHTDRRHRVDGSGTFHTPLLFRGLRRFVYLVRRGAGRRAKLMYVTASITVQMMHGSEWNMKYDEPEVENVARGRSPSATFSIEGHLISMSHERPCFICFVVWPTTSLKLYIVFWDGGETRVSIVCQLKMHTDLITVRG